MTPAKMLSNSTGMVTDAWTSATSRWDDVNSVINHAAAVIWIMLPSAEDRLANQTERNTGQRNGPKAEPGFIAAEGLP